MLTYNMDVTPESIWNQSSRASRGLALFNGTTAAGMGNLQAG